MSKKFLRFKPIGEGEYMVCGKGGVPLGGLAPRGEIFRRSPVYHQDGTEYTSSCLRELADAIDSHYGKRAASPQQPKAGTR